MVIYFANYLLISSNGFFFFLIFLWNIHRLYLNLRTANVKLDDFYKNQTWQEPLLLTEEGRPYNAPFETIGIQSMLFCNTYCMHLIKEDNVLPKNCLESALEDFYRHVMNMKDAKDLGYSIIFFYNLKKSYYCKRVLSENYNLLIFFSDHTMWTMICLRKIALTFVSIWRITKRTRNSTFAAAFLVLISSFLLNKENSKLRERDMKDDAFEWENQSAMLC